MAKSPKTGTILTVILLLATAAGGYFYWKKKDAKPPEVTTVTVTRGDLSQIITATGLLETPTTVDVSSQISGQINEVLVDFNTAVKKGDVLARIDPATYESRLRQAQAQLANADANYQLTRVNTERTRELRAKNLVSQQELDQAEALLTQADAQLKIQQANVGNAEVDLSRCTIYAPIDGIVLDRQCDVGKTVAASFNAPTLFTLVTDLGQLQISADVSEADIGNVTVDQEVTFTVDAFPGRQYRGKVVQIRNLPKTAQSVVVYSTIIEVRNERMSLKPGMTANVSIIIAQRKDSLKLPNSALRARISDAYLPKPVAPAGVDGKPAAPATGAPADPNQRREQMRQLFQEAGFSFGSGPPSPEVLARIQKLATERGIELPPNFGTRPTNSQQPQVRTVYRLASPFPNLQLEPVVVRLGISDGSNTEVIDGLKEGDVLVSSVFVPGEAAAPAAPTSNPFGGGPRRF